jgi:hypothetical protein
MARGARAAGLFSGLAEGIQTGLGMSRQRAIDLANARMAAERNALAQVQAKADEQYRRDLLALRKEESTAERTREEIEALTSPLTKVLTPSTAAALAPGFEAARQYGSAPETTPPGVGVLAPEHLPPLGKDRLRETISASLTKATEATNKIQAEDAARKEASVEAQRNLQRELAELRERGAAARAARAHLAAQEERERKARLLPEKDRTWAANMRDLIATAKDIRGRKTAFNTGPVIGLVPQQVMGKERAAFAAALEDLRSRLIQLRSGAAATDREVARLSKVVPTLSHSDPAFEGALDQAIAGMERTLGERLAGLKAEGRDTSPYEETTTPTVIVTAPDGRTKRVPADHPLATEDLPEGWKRETAP